MKTLLQEAGELTHQARALIDTYEGKATPADVQAQIDRLLDEAEAKTEQAQSQRQDADRKARVDALTEKFGKPIADTAITPPVEEKALPAEDRARILSAIKGMKGLDYTTQAWLLAQAGGISQAELAKEKAFSKFVKSGTQFLSADEMKSLVNNQDEMGGFLTAPEQFRAELIRFVDDAVFMRQLGTVIPMDTADSLGVPTFDTDMDDAEWTSELGTGSEDTALRFGKRALRPHPLAKRVKVSNTLLQRARVVNPESFIRERMGYKFAVTQEKGFLTGSGSQSPLGVFTASNDGIPTTRDVVVSTSSALDSDKLINAKYTLKPQYYPRARWLLHRDVLRDIRKIKDLNGVYVWQPGLQGDMPNMILDLPYTLSEYAPNTMSGSNYVGMLADFSYYWIAEVLSFQVQRLVELYAATNEVGFIGRQEIDGMPVLAEAFIRLKWS